MYVVENSNKKKVAQIIIDLPLNQATPQINYFEHDKRIQEINMHPTRNELVILEEQAFHLLISDYSIPYTLLQNGTLDECKLVVTEINGSVYYYAYLLKFGNRVFEYL